MTTSTLPLAAAPPAVRSARRLRAGRWLLGFLVWTLLALLVVLQHAVYMRSVG